MHIVLQNEVLKFYDNLTRTKIPQKKKSWKNPTKRKETLLLFLNIIHRVRVDRYIYIYIYYIRIHIYGIRFWCMS